MANTGRTDAKWALIAHDVAVTSNTTNTASFDASDGDWVEVIALVSSEAATSATNPVLKVEFGDDTNATSLATLAADVTVDATNERMVVYNVDLRGRAKKAVKLSMSPPSGANNNIAGWSAVARISRLAVGTADATTSQLVNTSDGQVVNVPT